MPDAPLKIERHFLFPNFKPLWPPLQKRNPNGFVRSVNMVRNHTIVSHVVERGYVNINNERQHASSVKDQACVSMGESALNAFRAKGAESVNTSGSNLRARSAKEARSASTDGIEMSAKNVAGVLCVNMEATDILAESVMEPGSANTINENSAVVNVEELLCANMVASMPNANPVADHRIVNMTCFVARVSSARQKWLVSIAIWCMWVESFPDGNPTAFGATVCSIQMKRFRDGFA